MIQQHTIIVGQQKDVDSCKDFEAILLKSESLCMVSVSSNSQSMPELLNVSNFNYSCDTVVVYTNGYELDLLSVLEHFRTNLDHLMRNIHFVFICQKQPFFVQKSISKYFNIIQATRTEIPSLVLVRCATELSSLEANLGAVNSLNVNEGELKDLKTIFSIRQSNLMDKKRKYVNSVSKDLLAKIRLSV